LAKLCLAATRSIISVCLKFVTFPSKFSGVLRARLCQLSAASAEELGNCRCAIATLQALLLRRTRPASGSCCVSMGCFSPPPRLCPVSAAQKDANLPAQERAQGKRGDTSLSCTPLCGERAPAAAFLPRCPCGTAPTSLQREREKTRKFHDEHWRERSLSLVS